MKRFFAWSIGFSGALLAWVKQVYAATVSCPDGVIQGGVCIPGGTGLSSVSVEWLIMSFMDWLLAIFGFLAIIAFVISGAQYILAAGDEKTAETAKRNMKYSIIGILVALSGWVIVYAIDQALSGNPYF